MSTIVFDGQQAGERILYELRPHPLVKYLAIAKMVLLSLVLLVILFMISSAIQQATLLLRMLGGIIAVILTTGSLWWNHTVYGRSVAYITDRRIMRFDIVSPFFTTKRSLFWNEALKAKGYAPSMLYRILGIGTVEIAPHMDQHEDVVVPSVAYYEDIANYIDKILFTYKQSPSALSDFKPFVPKPRWRRG